MDPAFPAGADPSVYYVATINWGDGSSSAGAVALDANGVFHVTGSHLYSEEGPFQITTVIISAGNSTGGATANAQVNDAPLSASGAAVIGTEGLALNPTPGGDVLVATFSDADPAGTVGPPSDYSASIDWGDGTATAATRITAAGSPSGVIFSVFGQHTYAEEGSYRVEVVISDVGGSQAVAHSEADVADAPLSAFAAALQPTFTEGVPATQNLIAFTDANPGATVADFTTGGGAIIVDWGDGTPADRNVAVTQPGGPGTAFFVAATHTYADSGSTGGHRHLRHVYRDGARRGRGRGHSERDEHSHGQRSEHPAEGNSQPQERQRRVSD